jgi:hypothetical protein
MEKYGSAVPRPVSSILRAEVSGVRIQSNCVWRKPDHMCFYFLPPLPPSSFKIFISLQINWALYISDGIKSCKQFMNCCPGDYKTRSFLDGVWT